MDVNAVLTGFQTIDGTTDLDGAADRGLFQENLALDIDTLEGDDGTTRTLHRFSGAKSDGNNCFTLYTNIRVLSKSRNEWANLPRKTVRSRILSEPDPGSRDLGVQVADNTHFLPASIKFIYLFLCTAFYRTRHADLLT